MRRQHGFSLIELLVTLAIILTLSAMASAVLMRSRIATNEASAVASVRLIATAETAYVQAYPSLGYTCNLSDLGPGSIGQPVTSASAGLIDVVLASGVKHGYTLSLANCAGSPVSTYNVSALPVNRGTTGVRSFCSGPSGVINFGSDGTATSCEINGTPVE